MRWIPTLLAAFSQRSNYICPRSNLFISNGLSNFSFGPFDTMTQSNTQGNESLFPDGIPFNASLYNTCDVIWAPYVISDHPLNSSSGQTTSMNSPPLFNHNCTQMRSTAFPTYPNHSANYLQDLLPYQTQPFSSSPSNFGSHDSQSSPQDSNSSAPHISPSSKTKPHSCPCCNLSFARASDLQRHFGNIHLQIRHHCLEQGCENNKEKGFSRREKLRLHLRIRHGHVGGRHKPSRVGQEGNIVDQ